MTRKLLAALPLVGFLLWAATVGFLLLGSASLRADNKADAPKKARYVHIVVFTLKKDAPKDAESALVADCHEMLAKIPSVRELRVGRPAEKATPKLAKTDYNVALTIFFDDYDGLMAYDKSDPHQQFIKKHLPNVEVDKLLVYDFEDQPK